MTRKKLGALLNKVFGWGIYVCVLLGGLSFFAFLAALLIGGGEGGAGEAVAAFVKGVFFPRLIQCTAAVIGVGLVSMYLNGESALSIVSEKKQAEEEIAHSKEDRPAED